MKKIILLGIFLLVIIPKGNSQVLIALMFGDKLNSPNVEFGLNVGLNASRLSEYPAAKPLPGFNLGLYFKIKLAENFYLHPEFLPINTMGSKGVDFINNPDPSYPDSDLNTRREYSYASLNLMPRFRLFKTIYLEAGPQFSYLYGARDKFYLEPEAGTELQYTVDISGEVNWYDAGILAGIGYKFKGGMNLSLRYYQGLTNTLRDASLGTQKNSSFEVHFGIPIGMGKEDVKNKTNSENN